MVDEIWIPLGENMLIERFRPVWNLVIDGFGNKDAGDRRKTQLRSAWDVMHPGRSYTAKLGANLIPKEKFIASLETLLRDGKVAKPKNPPGVKSAPQSDEEDNTEER